MRGMNKPITLGVVTTHPIQYQTPLFRELDARSGIELEVFFERIPDPEEQGKGFETAFTWDLPLLQEYSWRVLDGDRKSLDKEKGFSDLAEAYRNVDVMLVHGWQSSYMRRAWWAGLWTDVPMLVRGDSNSMKSRPWFLQLLHRLYLRPFEGYLYVGESNRTFYRKAGVPSGALYFSPRCVENNRFDENWKELNNSRAALRQRLGIQEAATCFLFCGKFTEKKRPGEVAKAFNEMRLRVERPVHLLMVGDGALRPDVEAVVSEEAPVTFTGFLNQTEIGKAYAAADVLVLPSDYGETWGLVVNEGMIFECPAIVSDRVGCGPDLVQEGETGYTFPFGDIGALANAMVRMAEVPDQVREMGARARELIMTDYTIERAADGVIRAAQDAYDEHA